MALAMGIDLYEILLPPASCFDGGLRESPDFPGEILVLGLVTSISSDGRQDRSLSGSELDCRLYTLL